uniref:DUF3778 domain-containing protein n=1 Tax=Oryza nivara TaxID=4536 RepID=A0A0E0GQT6_ORYNI
MGAIVVGGDGSWWRWRCEIQRPVDESTEGAGSLRRRRRLHHRLRPGGCHPVPSVACGDFSWLASSGSAVARSLLLVVHDDSPSTRWRFESFQCQGSIRQDSQDFSSLSPLRRGNRMGIAVLSSVLHAEGGPRLHSSRHYRSSLSMCNFSVVWFQYEDCSPSAVFRSLETDGFMLSLSVWQCTGIYSSELCRFILMEV